MALGAQRTDVRRMVLGFGFRLTLVGLVIGIAGALASTRLLGSLLFEVAAMNLGIFLAAATVLMAVAILASYLPARRAASLDPMQALRME
jgi:ABC-type antimicrobial peptide transport system permease subunit